jgi:hypothetical protein
MAGIESITYGKITGLLVCLGGVALVRAVLLSLHNPAQVLVMC